MRAKKLPWRLVMPPENLRFKLEQSLLLSDDADVIGRAPWDDCDKFDNDDNNDNDGGDDDEFFHEIANYDGGGCRDRGNGQRRRQQSTKQEETPSNDVLISIYVI